MLIEVQRALSTLVKSSKGKRALPPRFAARAPVLLAGIQEAAALSEDALPRMPHVARPVVTDATRRRIEALKKWRTAESLRLGLDVSVVLPQRLLEQVAEKPPARAEDLLRIEGFRRWRVAEFGPSLAAAATAPLPPAK